MQAPVCSICVRDERMGGTQGSRCHCRNGTQILLAVLADIVRERHPLLRLGHCALMRSLLPSHKTCDTPVFRRKERKSYRYHIGIKYCKTPPPHKIALIHLSCRSGTCFAAAIPPWWRPNRPLIGMKYWFMLPIAATQSCIAIPGGVKNKS